MPLSNFRKGVYMAPMVTFGPISASFCLDKVVIVKVIVADFYINTNIYKAVVKYGSIPIKNGKVI